MNACPFRMVQILSKKPLSVKWIGSFDDISRHAFMFMLSYN